MTLVNFDIGQRSSHIAGCNDVSDRCGNVLKRVIFVLTGECGLLIHTEKSHTRLQPPLLNKQDEFPYLLKSLLVMEDDILSVITHILQTSIFKRDD